MSLVSDEFLSLVREKTLLLGIGNSMKGDDGAGIRLLELLKGKVEATFINGGTSPENFLEKMASSHPETVIILDTMEFGGSPGDMRIVTPENVEAGGLSTHSLSPDIFIQYIGNRLPGTRVFLLGIQPKRCKLGSGLSEIVEESLRDFVKGLANPL